MSTNNQRGLFEQQEDLKLLQIKSGHRVYKEGDLYRGRFLTALGFWEIWTLDGHRMGLLHAIYAEEVKL